MYIFVQKNFFTSPKEKKKTLLIEIARGPLSERKLYN